MEQIPVAEILPAFDTMLMTRKAPQTAHNYGMAVRECVVSLLVDMDRLVTIEDLQRRRLQAWIDTQPGAPATVQLKVLALRRFLEFLRDEEYLSKEPPKLFAPKVPKRHPKFLSIQECEDLMMAPLREDRAGIPQVLAVRDVAILHVLWSGGLRASELCGLRMDRVRLDLPQPGDLSIEVFGKGDKWRWVVCPRRARDALERYLTVRDVLAKDARGAAAQALFLTQERSQLARRRLIALVQGHGAALGIHAYPHLLRHCCATHMLWRGAELSAVQHHLGHANPLVTGMYAHVNLQHKRDRATAHHPLFERPRRPWPWIRRSLRLQESWRQGDFIERRACRAR